MNEYIFIYCYHNKSKIQTTHDHHIHCLTHFMGPIYSCWHPTSHWFGHSYVLVHPVLKNICLSNSSIPTMGQAGPAEISIHFYHTTWCHTSRGNNHNSQDLKFSQQCCWRFKSSGILYHVDYQLTWHDMPEDLILQPSKSVPWESEISPKDEVV